MNTLRSVAILVEVITCFGPATLFLFASPIALYGGLFSGAAVFISYAAIVFGGGFGLFVVINLAVHVLINEHRLLSPAVILLGFVSGASACIGAIFIMAFAPVTTLVCLLPILGGAHLIWLIRKELRYAT